MGTALQKQQDNGQNRLPAPRPVDTLRGMLERSKAQIAAALPRHLTAERMIRVALTAFQRTPALQECSPLSVVAGVIQAAELGLELSGPLGQAYLVPYNNKNTKQKEAQFQVGYRGLLDLAYRSGRVSSITAHTVYQGDKFRFGYGTKPFIEHVPTMEAGSEIVAVYATVHHKSGGIDFEVMSRAQLDAHRKKYSRQSNGPWDSEYGEMAKKTVIRRLLKRVPVSVEVERAALIEEPEVIQPAAAFELPAPEPVLAEHVAEDGEVIEGGAAREPGGEG